MPKENIYIICGDGNCVDSQILPETHVVEKLQEKIRILEEDLNWAMGQIVIRDVIIEALQKNDQQRRQRQH